MSEKSINSSLTQSPFWTLRHYFNRIFPLRVDGLDKANILEYVTYGRNTERLISSLFPILFLFTISALPRNVFWTVKDYRHWSKQECEKMLTDSPWAQKGFSQSFSYVAQLFSALPIRQAIVRQQQIAENYDVLSPEKRQEYDKRMEEYLLQHFSDTIAVHLVHRGRLWYHWRVQTTETLKHSVFLIQPKRGRIPLQEFIVSPDAFQLIFPRQYKGRPVLCDEDKLLRLEFTSPVPKNSQRPGDIAPTVMEDFDRVFIEFKTSEMNFNGDLAY